ncbi:MAG: coenzyme F420-0:L-glutamate ligase [Patescibacteria group bacterium]
MIVSPVKTHKVIPGEDSDLYAILDRYLSRLKEKSVVAITSKIVAICEGRFVKIGTANKDDLIAKEAEYYLPRKLNKYGVMLTIKQNILAPSAGIDESNADGHYILWPKNPQKTANQARAYLRKKYTIKNLGVIITDSRTLPLRWGTIGVSLAYSGFKPLNNYIGKKDLFGRKLEVTQSNVADALAVTSVLSIGEGAEQTPIAIMEDMPFVQFRDANPPKKELEMFNVDMRKDDMYAPVLQAVKWVKGNGKR